MTHKDIRIPFVIYDRLFDFTRRYEAVGFLEKDEWPISGGVMFARTSEENGGAIGKGNEEFLRAHIGYLPMYLSRYQLVTGRHNPDNVLEVSCFGCSWRSWHQYWRLNTGLWCDELTLVVRRLP
ncbi:MAG: hypothetical protein UT67_C0002G0031 [Candidatus Magasanikbacteria bacterium GW2011_GWA2_40_10]|uniref:Uncharacterized protein n=1 Tax=Candidatus Magasanikbacteria bacterium GW2011_GWA2_40_10 TaxID=1619037 RepID=A0A0G0TC11_9BACT|nr:MAG: hypothetical protein UT67_C0002G0031 [Candidatus Magasanikbacteria bacterium GW2011_GWA2_40_10]